MRRLATIVAGVGIGFALAGPASASARPHTPAERLAAMAGGMHYDLVMQRYMVRHLGSRIGLNVIAGKAECWGTPKVFRCSMRISYLAWLLGVWRFQVHGSQAAGYRFDHAYFVENSGLPFARRSAGR